MSRHCTVSKASIGKEMDRRRCIEVVRMIRPVKGVSKLFESDDANGSCCWCGCLRHERPSVAVH